MDYKEIQDLIKAVNSSNINLFEMDEGNFHIKMDKNISGSFSEHAEKKVKNENLKSSDNLSCESDMPCANNLPCADDQFSQNDRSEKKEEKEGIIIKSPMVGTFYESSSPDAEAFVKVGSKVKKGDVICIIEAMKLMNEIESDYDGEITEVLVKNEDMVEYGKPLFRIKTN